jgi:membrane fusion protein (multidrug efflux system)
LTTGFRASRAARAGLAAVAVAAIAGCGGRPAPPPQAPPTVGVVTILPQPVPIDVELPGRVTPSEIAEVRPQVQGIIQARLFQEGAVVRAGQALYQIDPATYRAAWDQARAQLANAQAAVATASLKAQRYADLVKINAVSKQDNDDAQAAYKQAQAGVAQQRAAVETAKINLDYTHVTAPIGGRIGLSAVTRGALVTTGQTTAMTTVQKLDPIYVDVTQSTAEILRLQRLLAGRTGAGATSVRLVLEDGSAYPLAGTLGVRDITVDQATGAVTLRAVFANPAGVLLPGMYVRAVVTEGVDPAGLLAPQQGVARDPRGRPTALIVDRNGRAQLRDLQLGRAIGSQWLVTSGLAPGDRLIVEGLQKVQPGQPVRAAPADAAFQPPRSG